MVEVKEVVERLPCLQSNEHYFSPRKWTLKSYFCSRRESLLLLKVFPILSFPPLFVGIISNPVHGLRRLQRRVGDKILILGPRLRPVSCLQLLLCVLHQVERDWRDASCFALALVPGHSRLQNYICRLWKLCNGSPCSGGKCCRTACLSSAIAGRVIVAQIHTFHTLCLSYFTPRILTRSSLRVWGGPCDLSHRGPWWTAANPPPTLARCSGSPRSRGSRACPGERSEMTWRRKVPHRLKSLTATTCSGISLFHTQKSVEALLRSIPEHLPAATLKRAPTSPQRLAQESWRSSPSLHPATPGVHFFIFLSLNVP